MSKDSFSRYIWIVDTLRRRRRMTLAQLNEAWQQSPHTDGKSIERRTFYNYRTAILDLFGLEIGYDGATYEYFIIDNGAHDASVANWLLNSSAISDVLSASRDISDRIFLEDVPSARQHLATVLDAVRSNRRISFDYHNYSRSRPSIDVALEPYVVRIHKQRWYAVGRAVSDNRIKTYALDRMRNVRVLDDRFEVAADFDGEAYFADAFGIVVDKGTPQRIALRADHRTAHYLRDLPLHKSQEEAVHDGFSIFYYKMRVTDDFVTELLSYGPRLTVLEPRELRVRMIDEYRRALANYKEE